MESMKTTRRQFLGTAAAAGAISLLPAREAFAKETKVTDAILEKAAAQPVLQIPQIKSPVMIESIELLRKNKTHFVRVRSKDGAEGISVDDGRMGYLHPILNELVIPYFVGKDVRDLEEHLFQVYRYQSNYKLLGLALWTSVALVEFAILDMFGRMTNQPLGAMLGGVIRNSVPFYVASGRRDTTPEQEIEYLKTLVEPTGAKALKFRVGGRMSRNADAMPGRTDTLIPLVRKVFGDKMFLRPTRSHTRREDSGIRWRNPLRGTVSVRQF
jgi:L-alanine-DL-glutamate epimerase-like enolase superfamily enzyme